MICSVDECDRRACARGFCDKHYRRWKTHGDPTHKTQASAGEPIQWLLGHAAYDRDECLLWPFAQMRFGYGHLHVDGKFHPAHRHMCRLTYGEPPQKGMEAAHSCNNPKCVNPRHLRWATPKENAHDRRLAGTIKRGKECHSAFLTEETVASIRKRASEGEKQCDLAREFGLTRQHTNEVVARKIWRHVA